MNINLDYVQQGNKYLTHLTCFSGNCPAKRVVRTFSTSTNNTDLTRAQSRSILIRTNGRGGGRSKTSRKINIYINLLSLDENTINKLLYTIGLDATACEVAKMARSNLNATTVANVKYVYNSVVDNLSDSVKEYLKTLCN
tara:strand:- start:813 stop:1232 length:420 start_codon:yes stop_codon:yes gene_type:complete